MKFVVSRVSNRSEEEAPCDGATREAVTRVDERGFKSPDEFNTRLNEDWFARGSNHRILKGPRGGVQGIARDFADEAWMVEIDSLEAMISFADKYGDVIITHPYWNDELREIEIYDGYRE